MSNTNKTNWKKAKQHTVTLPSGSTVTIRIPNLAVLAKAGTIPNDLLKYAIPELRGEVPDKPSEEEVKKNISDLADFQAWCVSYALVDPELSADDVHETVPVPDIELIVQIALRQTDMDAVGHQIGGLETQEEFRRFRGLDERLSDILGP